MALKNCRECNAQVSSQAKVCPSCGIKKPYQSKIAPIITLVIVAVIAYISRSSDNSDAAISNENISSQSWRVANGYTFLAPKVDAPANEMKPFTLSQVCRAGMAVFLGLDVKIIKATASPVEKAILLSYKRPSDGKFFSNNCKISKNNIIWSETDYVSDRWNGEGEVDSLLTFSIASKTFVNTGNKEKAQPILIIEEEYASGGSKKEEFTLPKLMFSR
ncbi:MULTISPECIES: hypothetical protein [unclassified Serratia (in: enterobacteria)]|uniref:hypothetical protein n=1 Tax=unclassified Serratia (in: enterobacteria) TaxID=2647522 RepID=UPI0030766D90